MRKEKTEEKEARARRRAKNGAVFLCSRTRRKRLLAMQAKTTAIPDRDILFRCHIGVVVKFQVLHKLIVCFTAVIFVYTCIPN